MSLLLFTYRHQDIIARKSSLNLKLDALRRKLMDLQNYAASIADGTISMNELMESGPMFNRLSIFAQYAHQMAYTGAQEKFTLMSQMPGAMPQMQNSQNTAEQNAQLQQKYASMMFKNIYDQERQKLSDVDSKRLNKENTQIEQEKAKMETQLKMLDKEEEQITQAEDKAAEKSAPKFVA